MEDLQQRRRRPVTYGKTTRKRISTDFNDIFSSPSSRSPSVDAKESGGVARTLPTTNTSNPLGKSLQDKLPQVTKGLAPTAKNSKLPPIATTTARKLRSADPSSDEYASQSPTDVAAEAQLQLEHRASIPSIFDVPFSDDEDESAPKHTFTRKGDPLKPARKSNNKTAEAHSTTNMAASTKHPRSSAKPEMPVGPKSSKSIITGKITKLAKSKEQAATQTSLSEKRKGDTVPPHSRRVTRSQSVEPTTVREHPTIPKDTEFPIPRSGNIEVVIHTPETSPASKLPTQERKIDEPPPKKQVRRSLENIKSPTEIPVKKTKTAERPRTEKGAMTSLFAEELPPPKAQPRKRLIDTLGTDTGRPPKRRSTSPKADKESALASLFAEELPPKTQPRKRIIDALSAETRRPPKRRGTLPNTDTSNMEPLFELGSQYGSQDQPPALSQSRVVSESQESSQEIKITIQRQFGNGRGGPRITYGRQRSYRVEEVTEDNFEDFLLNMHLPAVKPLNSKRRLEYPTVNEDEEEIRPRTTIKSIHELRASGEHHRFMDDVEDLLFDVEGNFSIGIKRSGYFELAKKLCDKTFKRKFRANSFDERLFNKMDQQTDEIICFALSYLTLTFLYEDTTPRIMLHVSNNGAIPMLSRMLDSTRDICLIAKDKKNNLSKIAISQVSELRRMVEKSPAFAGMNTKVISPQLIALKVLDTLVRDFRERGSTDDILCPSALHGLVQLVTSFSNSPQYPKLLETQGLQLLELPLSTLEAYSMGGYGSFEEQVPKSELVALADLFPAMLGWTPPTNGDDLGPLLLLLLRLIINVTNNRPVSCENLADSPIIVSLVALIKQKFEELDGKLEEQARLLSVDMLILSLGLMLNLAETSQGVRAAVGDKAIPSVAGNPRGIHILLDIFLERRERVSEAENIEQSHTNVAFGYLSVLLGRLCQENHVRYQARGRLPNSSLKCLQEAIGEFIVHHKKVDRLMLGKDDGDEQMMGTEEEEEEEDHNEFTARLEDVMVMLRAYD